MTPQERKEHTQKIMAFNIYEDDNKPLKGFIFYATLENVQTNFQCYVCPCENPECNLIRFLDNDLPVQQTITHWKYNYSALNTEQMKKLNN